MQNNLILNLTYLKKNQMQKCVYKLSIENCRHQKTCNNNININFENRIIILRYYVNNIK